MERKQIALALGLNEAATEQEVLDAIAQLRKDAKEAVTLRQQAEQQRQEAIATLVDKAVAEGKFTADKKNHFVSLGNKVGLQSLKDTLELMTPAQRPGNLIKPANSSEGDYKTLSEVPADKLEALRKEQPEQYKTLYKAEYGIEPAMKD